MPTEPCVISARKTTEVEAHVTTHFIKADGNVGCMVNGAGLAMATMDMIKLSGGSRNFLDVGAQRTRKRWCRTESFAPQGKAILNIFGGMYAVIG